MKRLKYILLTLGCATIVLVAEAGLKIPQVLGDHMVLQRDRPVAVWGWADPGQVVEVTFFGRTKSTQADASGDWKVMLPRMKANAQPQEMVIRAGNESITLSNILIGEVWLLSGQSNMEKPLGDQRGQLPTFDYEEALRTADYPDIRLLSVARDRKDTLLKDVNVAWEPCNPASLDSVRFSAAGYYFGRKIHRELGVPIGLIQSHSGGSRIEPWTNREGFTAIPSLAEFASVLDNPQPRIGNIELSTMYNSMIAPLVPYTIRGVLWYQGESNVTTREEVSLYADKMAALIHGWRQVWGYDFPFYYVQIAPYHQFHGRETPRVDSPEIEALLWEQQTAALKIPTTGMVVTTDLVDDLNDHHPRDKKTVGERLAAVALAKTYGYSNLVCNGPMFRKMKIRNNCVVLSFRHTDGGLISGDGQPLSWFTIAGADGQFYPADAVINGDQVEVSSPWVVHPQAVRFAWDEAAEPNLFNGAGFPAVPFRTDGMVWKEPRYARSLSSDPL